MTGRFISLFALAATSAAFMVLAGCESAPKTQVERDTLHDEVTSTLNQYKREDPGMDEMIRNAYGYAVFPNIGKGGLIVGGAHGRGEVYEQGRLIGHADVTQGTVGLQAGGQTFSQVILFKDRDALERFKRDEFAFSANASAVAMKAGAAAAAKWENGVAVFTKTKGGLMAEASVGGQKFNFHPRQRD